MRVVFLAIAEQGHLNPLLPSARQLRARGRDVVVASFGDVAAPCAALGLRSVQLPAVGDARATRVTRGQAFAERLRDPAWLSAWVEALLLDDVKAQVPVLSDLLAREAPDVVVADPMLYAAAIACARGAGAGGVPWVGLSTSLNPVTPPSWATVDRAGHPTGLTDTLARLADRRRQLFVDHGVPVPRFFVSDAESPWLDVVFSVDGYAARAAADHAGAFAVGAPFDATDVAEHGRDAGVAFPWHRLADRRRLYCSFGSQAWFQPALFRRVAAAARALDLQLIASVGSLADDAAFVAALTPGSGDAIIVAHAPQLRLLAHVDVVVSHGGANTVVEALAHGVPLVLLPLCNDQPLQARFLTAAGAGVALEVGDGPDGSSVDERALEHALRQVLSEPVRSRARALGTQLRNAGGPARVAELVEQLCQERRPLRADDPTVGTR